MAAIPLNPDKAAQIVADWRTGEYSQRQLADKHKVSNGKVNQLCKGVGQDALPANRLSVATAEPRFIYIITADELQGIFKIGLTNDIERRLLDMQTASPYTLYALRSYTVSNAVAVEIMLHAFFHKKRLRGEWFRLHEADLKYIDEAMENVNEVLNAAP